jgi:hypothetical protein
MPAGDYWPSSATAPPRLAIGGVHRATRRTLANSHPGDSIASPASRVQKRTAKTLEDLTSRAGSSVPSDPLS